MHVHRFLQWGKKVFISALHPFPKGSEHLLYSLPRSAADPATDTEVFHALRICSKVLTSLEVVCFTDNNMRFSISEARILLLAPEEAIGAYGNC